MGKNNPHDPQNESELSAERRMALDDICGATISETEMWQRMRDSREARLIALHKAAIEAKERWDASGDPSDEAAFNAAFESWIAE